MSDDHWIAVDWGMSRLRVWSMSGDAAIEEADSESGVATLSEGRFEAALLALIEPWLGEGKTPVLACGSIGARQGWIEVPYANVPCSPLPHAPMPVPATDPRLDMHVLGGLSQSSPPDVMRGEETQIAGYLSGAGGFDGVICLPGTHSKWVLVSAGEVVSCQSFMTGELFDLLSRQSLLRHSVAGEGWDASAFDAALDETLSRPERFAARLFGLRAEMLLNGQTGPAARARLSGFLIGAELAAARPYWLGQPVVIIGTDEIARAYASALARQGATPQLADASACTLAGLIAARRIFLKD